MSQLSDQLFSYMPFIIAFAIFAAALRLGSVKGWLGELMVKCSAHFFLDKNIYHAVHNVTLPTLDGTTQIDHIFVSQYGIFVVETKNYHGWIFGSESQATWTQKIYKTSHKFQNPLRQNYKHIKALEVVLNLTEDKFKSVIVFVGGSTFKTEMPANVTYAAEYIRYIKSFQETVLSKSEVKLALAAISSGRLKPSVATNREHVKHLQSRSDVNAERKCPKCGNALAIRTRKTGDSAGQQFWGCSQFPKCRFTQQLA